jgi:hypothetical protein
MTSFTFLFSHFDKKTRGVAAVAGAHSN